MTQLTRPTREMLLSPPTRIEVEPLRDTRQRHTLLADYLEMTKVRITAMVVVTAGLGYALTPGATHPWWVPLAAMIGTALCCMGASVFNQLYERDTDGLMLRTRHRPLPAGRVSPAHAAILALLLSTIGVTLLWSMTTPLAAGLAAFTVLSYTLVYTPLKRVTSLSTIIGAVPGALPPVIGCAAACGSISRAALAMFAIMFIWQLPHFLAIAWLYREDYARARFPMLPVLDPSGASTFRQMLLGCLILLPVGLAPSVIGLAGQVYLAGSLLAGLGFLAVAVALVLVPTLRAARAVFFASLIYLPVVLTLMWIDRI